MQFTLKFEWFTEVPENLKNELQESAIERASEMIKEGFICGELNFESEDFSSRGWWSFE